MKKIRKHRRTGREVGECGRKMRKGGSIRKKYGGEERKRK